MDPVIQILYIVVGVIFAIIIDTASKFIVPIFRLGKENNKNWVHIIYCFLTPLVIWQFVFQFAKRVKKNGLDIDFFPGILLLITFCLMALISKVVYPDDVGAYTLKNKKYNERINETKPLFFGLLSCYLLSLTCSYLALFSISSFNEVDQIRLVMALVVFIFFLVFRRDKKKKKDKSNKDKVQSLNTKLNDSAIPSSLDWFVVLILTIFFLIFVFLSMGWLDKFIK